MDKKVISCEFNIDTACVEITGLKTSFMSITVCLKRYLTRTAIINRSATS